MDLIFMIEWMNEWMNECKLYLSSEKVNLDVYKNKKV